MQNIRMPFPPLGSIRAGLDTPLLVSQYMRLLSNAVGFAFPTCLHEELPNRLEYDSVEVREGCIYAYINITALPSVADCEAAWRGAGFADQLVLDINNHPLNDTMHCPTADLETVLYSDMRKWQPVWVSIYLWRLFKLHFSKSVGLAQDATNKVFVDRVVEEANKRAQPTGRQAYKQDVKMLSKHLLDAKVYANILTGLQEKILASELVNSDLTDDITENKRTAVYNEVVSDAKDALKEQSARLILAAKEDDNFFYLPANAQPQD